MASQKESKLWGGRFSGDTDPAMEKFNASISFDKRLYKVDIQGSKAYAKALLQCGLINADEEKALQSGMDAVLKEWDDGTFKIVASDEDIHTANERRLSEIVGADIGGKLHTGRSRNDQVATDVRLWLRDTVADLRKLLVALIHTAVERASADIDVLMPGYTHLQQAQVIRFSHWVMSHAWAWRRDLQRLDEAQARINVLPLGSGALAGTPFAIDRTMLAKELGCNGVTENSMDGTGNRDFILDFMYWATMTMTHLSKFAEDLIIYSSKEFSFVSLADAYSTGSSIMPQKKNPDSLELIRGKSGRVTGNFLGLLITMKGLPSTYNKDLQEDKEPMFDIADTMEGILQISAGVLATLKLNQDKIEKALSKEMLATDLAYYLVRQGVPFRKAHGIVGQIVQKAEEANCAMDELDASVFTAVCPQFKSDVTDIWNYEHSAEQYQAQGGTSKAAVQKQIERLSSQLKDLSE